MENPTLPQYELRTDSPRLDVLQVIGGAFNLFRKDVVTSIVGMLLFLITAIIGAIIPIINFLFYLGVLPLLLASWIYIAQEIDSKGKSNPGAVYSAFEHKKGNLILAFFIFIIIYIGVLILSFLVFGFDEVLQTANGYANYSEANFWTMMIVYYAFGFILQGCFFLVGPILIFGRATIGDALAASTRIFFDNFLRFLGLFLLLGILNFVGTLPFGLGLFITMPITLYCVYMAYKQFIVEHREEDDELLDMLVDED